MKVIEGGRKWFILIILIATMLFITVRNSKDTIVTVETNEDNIPEAMRDYLTKSEMEKVRNGFEKYITLVEDNTYSGVKGILKAYLDIINEYDYNQQKIKFADHYATLSPDEREELFSSYSDKEKFHYFFDGSRYNAYFDNTTVCLGFSDIFEDYLEKKGYEVEPIVAIGYTVVDEELVRIPYHKFLRVLIEDKWYYINPSSDYDGNISSFKFLLTSKEGIKRAFEELGNIYIWDEDSYTGKDAVFSRRELIRAFLDIRDDEIARDNGLYINIDRAIKEYIQESEEYKEIDDRNYLVVDDDFFSILSRTEVFGQFKNLYIKLTESKIPYRMYVNIFSEFQSADIMFDETMKKDEVQKIQKAYLSTRRVGKKTRVQYPYDMEGLSKELEDTLKILLSSDYFKPLPEGKVRFIKDIQINMTDTRIDEFEERFKYLHMLESLDFIYINNESLYDVFQIQSLRDSGMPVFYSCNKQEIEYGDIKNKVYLRSTIANFDDLAKSLQGKGDIVVINNYQSTEEVYYIDEYETTDLDTAIEQKKQLNKEQDRVVNYVQRVCDTNLPSDIASRKEAIDIYKEISRLVDDYINDNIDIKEAYLNATAFEQATSDGFDEYINLLVHEIIDKNYMNHDIKIFRAEDIISILKNQDGIIKIVMRDRNEYSFTKKEISKAVDQWNGDKYIFEERVRDRIMIEIGKEEI